MSFVFCNVRILSRDKILI